jgi:hypothetical protein
MEIAFPAKRRSTVSTKNTPSRAGGVGARHPGGAPFTQPVANHRHCCKPSYGLGARWDTQHAVNVTTSRDAVCATFGYSNSKGRPPHFCYVCFPASILQNASSLVFLPSSINSPEYKQSRVIEYQPSRASVPRHRTKSVSRPRTAQYSDRKVDDQHRGQPSNRPLLNRRSLVGPLKDNHPYRASRWHPLRLEV